MNCCHLNLILIKVVLLCFLESMAIRPAFDSSIIILRALDNEVFNALEKAYEVMP